MVRISLSVLNTRVIPSSFSIGLAFDGSLDAWRGAASFTSDSSCLSAASVTRTEYEERVADFLREHQCSNRPYKLTREGGELATAK